MSIKICGVEIKEPDVIKAERGSHQAIYWDYAVNGYKFHIGIYQHQDHWYFRNPNVSRVLQHDPSTGFPTLEDALIKAKADYYGHIETILKCIVQV